MGRRTKSKQRVQVLEKASERCIACGVDCLPGLERCWNCGTALPAVWAGASASPSPSETARHGPGLAPDPVSGLDGFVPGAPPLNDDVCATSLDAAPPSPADAPAAGGPLRLSREWYAQDVGAQLARRLEREGHGGWRARLAAVPAIAWLALAVVVVAVAGAVGYWVGTPAPGADGAGIANIGNVDDVRRDAWRPDRDPALLPTPAVPSSSSAPVSAAGQPPAAKLGEPEQKARTRRDSAPTKLGAAVYKETCSACHDPGRGTGPAVDRPELWMERFARGKETLYASVRDGKGEMKPRAGNPTLGNEDLEAAVDYMTDRIIRLSVERAVARMPFAGNGELSLSNSALPAREEGAGGR